MYADSYNICLVYDIKMATARVKLVPEVYPFVKQYQ